MKKNNGNENNTFVRITNQTIYDEILEMKQQILQLSEEQQRRSDILETNIKVVNSKANTNRMISIAAISLCMFVLGWFITHLNSSVN